MRSPGQRDGAATVSVAVLRGPDAGALVLERDGRLSVGAARDNDLVLTDPGADPRHFFVDAHDARPQPWTSAQRIAIDRQWRGPDGETGALVFVGTSELLVVAGRLDERFLRRLMAERRGPEAEATMDGDRPPDEEATRIAIAGRPPPDPPAPPRRGGLMMDAGATMMAGTGLPGGPLPGFLPSIGPPEDEAKTAIGAPLDPVRAGAPRTSLRTWDTPSVEPERGASERAPPARSSPPVARVRTRDEVVVGPAPAAARSEPPRAMVRVHRPGEAPGFGDRARASFDVGPRPGRSPEAPGGDAWGTRGAGPAPERPKGNAWGDRPERSAPPAPRPSAPPPDPSPPRAPGAPERRTIEALAARRPADPALHVLRHPDGPYAARLRVMGTKLSDVQRTFGYKTFMVTSAEPCVGKTTVATNLALALAEDPEHKIALVEADFRYPRLAGLLGVPSDVGLLSALEGTAPLAASIVKIEGRNLVAFPSGGRHANPAAVLASPRFKTILAELATTVDIAIVDAPTVGAVADANLLAPLFDAVLFVVLGGLSRSSSLERAVRQVGAQRVIGAVYNEVSPRRLRDLRDDARHRLESVHER